MNPTQAADVYAYLIQSLTMQISKQALRQPTDSCLPLFEQLPHHQFKKLTECIENKEKSSYLPSSTVHGDSAYWRNQATGVQVE
jgi:hypothetical protein